MNLISRKPREKDRRDIAFDARPKHPMEYASPEAQAVIKMTESLKAAPRATEANQDDFSNDPFPLSRLDEIAQLVGSLTYGEMMVLAAALWKMRPEGKEVTEQQLPGMLHRWSAAGSGA